MKKTLLLAAAATLAMNVAQAKTYPELNVFNYAFNSSADVNYALDPFTSWASEGELNDYFTEKRYTTEWGIVSLNDGNLYAGNCSSFKKQTTAANAGLVTPKIKIPAQGAVLSFFGININPQYSGRPNPIKIYVSTAGNSKEDFTEENFLKQVRMKATSQTNGSTLTEFNIAIGSEYAGKEVYIALVNTAINAGLACIQNVTVDSYKAETLNTTPTLYSEAGEYPVTCTAQLMTGLKCEGYKAELVINGKVYSTVESNRELSADYSSYTISFPDKVKLAQGETVNYTVHITPNIEGVKALSFSGTMTCKEGFKPVIVEEEGTGEYCGFCPLGAAWMAYLNDKYPEDFIGISVHGGGYATGVMTVSDYANPFLSTYNDKGYPFCMLNRDESPSPQVFTSIEPTFKEMLEKKTPMKVAINKTYYYPADNKITVDFATTGCCDMENADYKAAVVLLANGLSGTDDNWMQLNSYAGASASQLGNFGVTSANSAELAPYFEVYTNAPSYYKECIFDHVAMGIWPDWRGNGCPLNSKVTTSPESYNITFDVPMQTKTNGFGVQDMTKTSVVVLIFNGDNGKIVAAQKMPYAEFTHSTTGVEQINSTAMNVERSGDMINFTAPEGTTVELYSADGLLLTSKTLTAGSESIAANAFRGLVIVRMTNGNDNYLKKILF